MYCRITLVLLQPGKKAVCQNESEEGNNKYRKKGKVVECPVTDKHQYLRILMQFLRNALPVALKHITGSKKFSLHNSDNQRLFETEIAFSRWTVILLDALRFMFDHWESQRKKQQLFLFLNDVPRLS
jgi:hypothetical protein